LLLVSSKYTNEVVTLDTSSPESTTRIHVVLVQGKLKSVDPGSAVLFMGGG
jgi:hypothetical protein